MSLNRTPPRSYTQTPATASQDSVQICSVCGEPMLENQDCLILNECSHNFHRVCVETSMSTSSECPTCKRPCQLSDLRKYIFIGNNTLIQDAASAIGTSNMDDIPSVANAPSKPTVRSKGRGARAHYNTRSRGLFQEQQNSILDVTQENHNFTPDRNQRGSNTFQPSRNGDNTTSFVDYTHINRMIEQNLLKILGNLNLVPPYGQNCNQPHENNPGFVSAPRQNSNVATSNAYNANPQGLLTSLQASENPQADLLATTPSSLRASFTTDKISAIIQSWNLKFDGSQNGLHIDEFLYRVQSLTLDTFDGDFSVVCKNLQILLTGKARDWYWRYRKQVPSIQWETFCASIKSQYRDSRTAYDIREEIRNRKQKQGESFDVFFDTISAMMDRLPTPMTEAEIVEILIRNLRPEIRQEILYVPVKDVSHLRNLVQMREHFLNDEHVRRNLFNRSSQNYLSRRQIAGIDFSREINDVVGETEMSVDALQEYQKRTKCWNCDQLGHHWENCLEDRQVFCYGCGTKKIYKPNCTNCLTKKNPKNFNPHIPISERN